MRIGFGPFILDSDTRQLMRDGRGVHLTPKAFDLLVALAAERPNVLSKAVLQERPAPNTFVVEANRTALALLGLVQKSEIIGPISTVLASRVTRTDGAPFEREW